MHNRLCLFICLTLTSLNSYGASSLFSSDDDLNIQLTAEFRLLSSQRDKTRLYPGQLKVNNIEVPVDIRVRGNFRLKKETCRFPPLSVDFKKNKDLKDSPFAKQQDLKLVVQCKPGKVYLSYLRAEFLTYKALNMLTDMSYRVRWVEVTYTDQATGKQTGTRSAFFVEKKKRVAKRNGLKTVKGHVRIAPEELKANQAALLDLFQFIIGNTDYSLIRSTDPTDCCHNAKLLRTKEGIYVPGIYDFDNTGLVNASYAQVSPELRIRKVTNRLYRGYCRDAAVMSAAREQLLSNQEKILALFTEDAKLGKRRKRSKQYLGKSFEIIAKQSEYTKKITNACR